MSSVKICPIIVGCAGISASGKTRTAHMLADILMASNVCTHNTHINPLKVWVVSHDRFYRALEQGEDGLTHDWDSPTSYDVAGYIDTIQKLANGESVWLPCHDFSTYTRNEQSMFISLDTTIQNVIIVEGIHVLADEYLHLYDIRLFIGCECDIALGRRITRDMSERGYPLETVLMRYYKYVRPALIKWILPSQKNAHMIIHNDGDIDELVPKIEVAATMIRCLF